MICQELGATIIKKKAFRQEKNDVQSENNFSIKFRE
jgi:hypothetical protein